MKRVQTVYSEDELWRMKVVELKFLYQHTYLYQGGLGELDVKDVKRK